MSSSGFISAMASSLKNNKIKKRSFHDGFRDVDGIQLDSDPLKFKNKLSKEEFEEFSHKLMEKKRKSNLTLSITYGLCVLVVFVIVFGFL